MDNNDVRLAEQFASYARSYCSLIDVIRDCLPERFYAELLRCLSNLCGSALDIPQTTPESEYGSEFDISHEERSLLAVVVQKRVASAVHELLRHNQWHEDVRTRYLMYHDDLSDIYSDVKQGLNAWDKGTSDAKLEAIWQWRFGYESHWGNHLMSALHTTHEIVF